MTGLAESSRGPEAPVEEASTVEIVVITGLSGAGRTEAAKSLEDLGWFVIDNLPPSLIPKVSELAAVPASAYERVAFVMGSAPEPEPGIAAIHALRAGDARVRVLFLDASTEVLVRRYESTRRRHPVPGRLTEAIDEERRRTERLLVEADVVVDTTELNVHQLRARVEELFGSDTSSSMQVRVVSFGYKHGLPRDADLVVDCRFLSNPHWIETLRPLSGLDEPVRAHVLDDPHAGVFLDAYHAMLDVVLPAYQEEGKAYLTIAVGCTGGQHRSVVMAEEIGARLAAVGFASTVTHRDVER